MALEGPSLLQRSKCFPSEQSRKGRGQLKGWIDLERRSCGPLERHPLGQHRYESGLAFAQADKRRVVRPSQNKEMGGS